MANEVESGVKKEYEPGQGTWLGLAIFWAITLILCAVSYVFTGPIGILMKFCGIIFLIICCKASYSSFMYPEKYIIGNLVPGDTSDSD